MLEVHLTPDGRILLPDSVTKELGLGPDDRVLVDVVGDEVRIRKPSASAVDRFAGILHRYFATEASADQWLKDERDAWHSH